MRPAVGILLAAIVATACSSSPVGTHTTTGAKMQMSDDITVKGNQLPDPGRFQFFLQSVEKGNPDHVRIIQTTVEGDPVYQDLRFNGKTIEYTFDTSEDKFAGSGRGKHSTTCKGFKAQKNERGTEYVLEGCGSAIGRTFSFVVRDDTGFTADAAIAKILNDNKWNLPAFPDKPGKVKGMIHGGDFPPQAVK